MMGWAKDLCAYKRYTLNNEHLVAAKTYALISEYALICDMRLITREYGIYIYILLHEWEGNREKYSA